MEKCGQKKTENGPKIDIKIASFLYLFRIYSLKIFAGGGLGATAQVVPPGYVPAHKLFLYIILFITSMTYGNFGVLASCRNFVGPHVGPLFGRTC